MSITKLLQEAKKFEIQAYKRTRNIMDLRKTNVPFTGSPLKHPYDPEKVVLLSDPFSSHAHYYEFRADDISHVEELPSIVTMDGDTMSMARLWVKKGTIGLRCAPFVVADISGKTD